MDCPEIVVYPAKYKEKICQDFLLGGLLNRHFPMSQTDVRGNSPEDTDELSQSGFYRAFLRPYGFRLRWKQSHRLLEDDPAFR